MLIKKLNIEKRKNEPAYLWSEVLRLTDDSFWRPIRVREKLKSVTVTRENHWLLLGGNYKQWLLLGGKKNMNVTGYCTRIKADEATAGNAQDGQLFSSAKKHTDSSVRSDWEQCSDVVPEWMLNLEEEDISFIKNFVLASGSLKDIAQHYQVTYPDRQSVV